MIKLLITYDGDIKIFLTIIRSVSNGGNMFVEESMIKNVLKI
jgi:hypothetical protein